MKFSANVSILFEEGPALDRFGRAAAAGFSAVERNPTTEECFGWLPKERRRHG